jgi:hypothetical protein
MNTASTSGSNRPLNHSSSSSTRVGRATPCNHEASRPMLGHRGAFSDASLLREEGGFRLLASVSDLNDGSLMAIFGDFGYRTRPLPSVRARIWACSRLPYALMRSLGPVVANAMVDGHAYRKIFYPILEVSKRTGLALTTIYQDIRSQRLETSRDPENRRRCSERQIHEWLIIRLWRCGGLTAESRQFLQELRESEAASAEGWANDSIV